MSNEYEQYIVASYNRDEKTSVIELIHNSILNLFGNGMHYEWRTTHNYNPIPHLQNMKACIRISNESADSVTVENVFLQSPKIKFVILYASSLTEQFNTNSKVYHAEFIEIIHLKNIFPFVMQNFQERQAFLRCYNYETTESTEIANKWKSGEAFEELDLLRIELHSSNLSQGEILNAIGAKYIDETKRAPTHTLPKICNWNNNQITNSITSHIYVVRKTDKHVASVLIREKTFSFGVWDKTEEEFLRMVG